MDKKVLNKILKKYKTELDACIEENICLEEKIEALTKLVAKIEQKIKDLGE